MTLKFSIDLFRQGLVFISRYDENDSRELMLHLAMLVFEVLPQNSAGVLATEKTDEISAIEPIFVFVVLSEIRALSQIVRNFSLKSPSTHESTLDIISSSH